MNTRLRQQRGILDRICLITVFEQDRLSTPNRKDNPCSYKQILNGKIIYLADEEKPTTKDEVIGAFRLSFVNVFLASENDMDLYELFDGDGDIFEFFEAAFNIEEQVFNNQIAEALNDDSFEGLQGNILFVDRLGIIPEIRSQKIGRYVLKTIVEKYSLGAQVIAINPVPFEFNSSHIKMTETDWAETDTEADKSKLRELYGKVGFNRIPGANYMVLNSENKLPEIY